MRLSQQSTALRPFVGESIALAPIAVRTGKHHIAGIMARRKFSTGNRNNMIEIIDIRSIFTLLKFSMTTCCIIASVLLDFQFGLNVLHRQRSLDAPLAYMPFLLSNALPGKVLFAVTLIVLFLPIVDFFTMGGPIEYRVCKHLFFVLLIIPFVVFSMSIPIGFILSISALFAARIKATSRVSMEELGRRGEPLQTFGALLLRKINRKHDLNCLSFSGPCFCRLPGEQGYSLFTRGNYSHAMQPSTYYTILFNFLENGREI